jgi:glycosyltransferase involved in cell wall biosynthesis
MTNDAPYLFDVSRLMWRQWADLRPTGIDRICLAWLENYASRSQAVIIHKGGNAILPMDASQALFRRLLAPATGKAVLRASLIAWTLCHGWQALRPLPGHGRLWFNIGHTGLNFPNLGAWCRTANVRPVLMLHDLIPITHPQYCRAGEADRHRIRVDTLLQIATAVIGNSKYTLDTLADYARLRGLPIPPSEVAWPGTPHLAMPPGQRPPPSDEFIILGTIEGRKNHLLLLDVWERLIRKHGGAAPRLVIIGRRGWACDDVLERLDSGRFGDRVVETGALDDAAIAQRLASARALLFPSFAEGYGLPLVEALDAGVPVIASDLPVFREIGQGVPDLLPPGAVDRWATAISHYAQPDSPGRAAQLARLAGFRAPDWPGHFARVEAFLARITG